MPSSASPAHALHPLSLHDALPISFVNAGIAQALSVIVQSIAFWGMGVYPWETIWYSFLSYLPMMMFPEGTVNGMFITAMVVFHNRWLSTFDANSYFK